jgi:type IV pilus assembly protein PilX
MKNYMNNSGMVLVVALILLLPLTLIAVSVMQWAREDVKMAGASSSRALAEQQQQGLVENVLVTSNLATKIAMMATSSSVTTGGTAVPLTLVVDTSCKPKLRGYSTNLAVACRYVDAELTQTFAKGGMGQLQTTIGIEQRLKSTTN